MAGQRKAVGQHRACSNFQVLKTNGRQGRRKGRQGSAEQGRAGQRRAGLGRAGQNRTGQGSRNAGPGERPVACPQQSCSKAVDMHNLVQGQEVVSYSPRHKALPSDLVELR